MIFIPKDNIDTTYWNPVDNFSHMEKKNTKLEIGNYVCVKILNKRINKGDTQIKTIGKLLNLATELEVDKFFGNKIIDENNEESNYI